MSGEGGNIKIFMRVRPSKRPSGYFTANPDVGQLEFTIPDASTDSMGHSRASSAKFRFDGIFDMKVHQEEVFDLVAKDAVDSALDGYNATIFAYGQTGSGKTFTITGGAERYQDRGIIPRALSRIFNAFKDRPTVQYTAYISYLELYNEVGYDLLDPSHETKTLEELPRVALMEDEEGCVHLKNLSMHAASNEEEALNLLFLGDTNRAIAETPMNLASSRSHCIFTISIESRQEGSSTIRRSKLHLVDLAGSERTHKTNSTGQLFREATHINKSLHFLEMVIVALQEQKKGVRSHIPYRNSMLTSVIRDSLGGNCRTSMIATINPEPEHTDESVSTCRFAQRVARVQNAAIVNEETDPNLLIRQLKTKLQSLESEMKFVKGEAGEGEELTDTEKEQIVAAARTWIAGPVSGEFAIGKLTLNRIQAAFAAFHKIATELREAATHAPKAAAGALALTDDAQVRDSPRAPAASDAPSPSKDELKKLKVQLQQRDNEIAILVNMVKSAKATAAAQATLSSPAPTPAGPHGGGPPLGALPLPPAGARMANMPPQAMQALSTPTAAGSGASVGVMLADGTNISEEVMKDRDKAFDAFKASYPKNDAIEENKRILREKYDGAKTMAERVNRAREETNRLKAEIERRRVEKAMANIVDGSADADGKSDVDGIEAGLKSEMDAQKTEYKTAFQSLRDLKAEIEHIQRLLESNRSKMQSDFESWYANCLERLSMQQSPSSLTTRASVDAASTSSSAPMLYSGPPAMSGRPSSEGVGGAAMTSGRPPMPANPAFSAPMQAPPSGTWYGQGMPYYPGPGPYPQSPHPLMPGQVALPYMPMPPMGYGYPPGMHPGTPPAMISPAGMPGFPGHPATPPAVMPTSQPAGAGIAFNRGAGPASTVPAQAITAPPGVTLTGNAEADADIIAFYKAKEELLRRTKSSSSGGFAGVLAEAAKVSATMQPK